MRISDDAVVAVAEVLNRLSGMEPGEELARAVLDAAAPQIVASLLALADERDKAHGAIRGHITTYELRQALGKVQP